jgi:hypothetical protein
MVTFRRAIALIELLLAIVIMAIVLIAVPLIIEEANRSDATTVQQEAVLIAASQLNAISALQWDENEYAREKRYGGFARILDVFSTSRYERYPVGDVDTFRIGSVTLNAYKGRWRRKFYAEETNASSTLGPDSGTLIGIANGTSESSTDSSTFDDIDDYNNFTYTLTRTDSHHYKSDYKFDYTVSTKVAYRNDDLSDGVPATTPTNVKFVTVTVTDTINDTNITLFSFMCNIGETKYLVKRFGSGSGPGSPGGGTP